MEHGAHGYTAGRVCPVHAAQAAGLVSAVKGSESECLLPPHWSQWKSETPVGHCRLRAGVEASWGRDMGRSAQSYEAGGDSGPWPRPRFIHASHCEVGMGCLACRSCH